MDAKQQIFEFLTRYIERDELTEHTNIFELGVLNSLFSMPFFVT